MAPKARHCRNNGSYNSLFARKAKNKGIMPIPTMIKQNPHRCLNPILFFFIRTGQGIIFCFSRVGSEKGRIIKNVKL
jgi:hypothetical protein